MLYVRDVLVVGMVCIFLVALTVGGLFFPEAMKRWEEQGGPGHKLFNEVWMWRLGGLGALAMLILIIVSLARR